MTPPALGSNAFVVDGATGLVVVDTGSRQASGDHWRHRGLRPGAVVSHVLLTSGPVGSPRDRPPAIRPGGLGVPRGQAAPLNAAREAPYASRSVVRNAVGTRVLALVAPSIVPVEVRIDEVLVGEHPTTRLRAVPGSRPHPGLQSLGTGRPRRRVRGRPVMSRERPWRRRHAGVDDRADADRPRE